MWRSRKVAEPTAPPKAISPTMIATKLDERLRRRKRARLDRAHREAESDERGRVVDEAFAFENHQQPARQTHAF